MKIEELTSLREQRLENETINETKVRLDREKASECRAEPKTTLLEPDELLNEGELAIIPRWKLIQPSCRIEGATLGCFRNTLTDEEVARLENVVFMQQFNTRSLFAQDDYTGERTCSNDGYFPARDHILTKTGHEPKSLRCASREDGKLVFRCPFAIWRNQAGEPDPNGTKPPICKASVAFFGLDAIHMPFWLILHGSALPIVKSFLRYVTYRRKQSAQQGQVAYLHDFKLTIGLQLQSNKKGRFYTPVFERKDEISGQDERMRLLRYYEAFKDRYWPEPVQDEDE